MDGQVIVNDAESALTLVAEKPYTFYTAITRVEGNVEFDKFADEAKVFQKEFQNRLLKVTEEEGKTKDLVDFVQKHVSDEGSVSLHSAEEDSDECGEEEGEEEEGLEENNFDNVAWLKLPFAAVRENRIDILNLCAKSVDDFNMFRWVKRMNLLMYALNQATVNDDMLEYLLANIKAEFVTENGDTALNICLSNKSIDVDRKLQLARKLIENGVSVNSSKLISSSALHSYCDSIIGIGEEKMIGKWKDFVDLLLDAGQNIDQKDWLDQTPLMVLLQYIPPLEPDIGRIEAETRNEKLALAKYLLLKGADPNVKDSAGRNCVHMAVTSQSDDVVRVVINSGGDVNAQNNLGMTPAYLICCDADWSRDCDLKEILSPIIHSLVNAGCDLNIQGIDKSTVLHFAAVKGNLEMCRLLVSLGSNIHSVDYLRRTPLHMSARNPNCDVSAFLIKHGAEIDCRDVNNCTPLHIACLFNNIPAAKVLVEHGANVLAKDDLEIQPIHLAAENGTPELLQFLSVVSDANAKDLWRATPLHYAASDGNYETAELLKSAGIDICTTDTNGKTALHLAIYRGHLRAATLLSQPDSDPVFGHLPPNLFPNRPLVPRDDVDKYFDNLVELFEKQGLKGQQAVKAILESKGLGRVDLKVGEGREISERVIKLAEDILVRVQELSPLFRCKLLHAGSSSENVKVGYPDEFDFIFDVESISEYIERLDQGATAGFAKVVIKDSSPENIKKFCVRASNVLNAAYFLRYFGKLCCQATYDVLSSGKHKFYTGNMLLRDHGPLFYDSPIPLAKLVTFTFTYRGKDNKFLDVSVDFNPVLHFHEAPKELNLKNTFLSDTERMGTYIIPKYCKKVHGYPRNPIPLTSDLWRYSTHHLEAVALKSLPPSARDCFMLCKALRMEPMTCSVENVPVYKKEPMFKMDTLGISNKEGNSGVSFQSSGLGDGEEGFINPEVVHQTLDGIDDDVQDYGEEDDGDEEEKEEDTEDVEEDEEDFWEDDEDKEITAEKAIPSYYLKIIFIKEMEELNKRGRVFNESDIPAMTKRVYARLQHALDVKELRSLFLPMLNELQSVEEHDPAKNEMRQQYCSNIVKVLDKLEFKDTL